MGFHEPQPFVDAPRNLGKQIRSAGIIEFLRLANGGASLLAECGKRRGHRVDVGHALHQRERIPYFWRAIVRESCSSAWFMAVTRPSMTSGVAGTGTMIWK